MDQGFLFGVRCGRLPEGVESLVKWINGLDALPEVCYSRGVGLSKTGNRGWEWQHSYPRKVRTPQSRMLDNVQ